MRALLLVAAGLAIVGCAPHRDVPVSEVPKLAKLTDVMDVQATVMDPQFKKRGQATYADVDWVAFVDAATRVQATSLHIKDFTKGPAFDALAMELNTHARELSDAANAKDAAAASKALVAMKTTCGSCHKKFR
jgi:hypothetical protein